MKELGRASDRVLWPWRRRTLRGIDRREKYKKREKREQAIYKYAGEDFVEDFMMFGGNLSVGRDPSGQFPDKQVNQTAGHAASPAFPVNPNSSPEPHFQSFLPIHISHLITQKTLIACAPMTDPPRAEHCRPNKSAACLPK